MVVYRKARYPGSAGPSVSRQQDETHLIDRCTGFRDDSGGWNDSFRGVSGSSLSARCSGRLFVL